MNNTNNRLLRSLLIVSMIMTMLVALSATSVSASVKPKKITITPTKYTLTVGKTKTIKVSKVTPSKASKAVYYKSSNKSVATVSSKGVVKAKKAGKATITVTSKKNSKVKAKCYITVKAKPAPAPENKKSLVIYFSHGENIMHPYAVYEKYKDDIDALAGASVMKDDNGKIVGNAGVIGSWIAEALNTRTYSIHVTRVDENTLLYPETKEETQKFFREYEQAVGSRPTRPAIASMTKEDPDLSQYEMIYLGFPNWDGEPSHAVYTFIEEHREELDGKIIAIYNPGHFKKREFQEAKFIIAAMLPNSVVLNNQILFEHADFADENRAAAKESTLAWVKATQADALKATTGGAEEVSGQKALAQALIGQKLTAAQIEEKVGKWTKKWDDVNGCNHEVASTRFYYTGFVIYTRPVGINDENIGDIGEDTLASDVLYEIYSVD